MVSTTHDDALSRRTAPGARGPTSLVESLFTCRWWTLCFDVEGSPPIACRMLRATRSAALLLPVFRRTLPYSPTKRRLFNT